MAKEFKLVQKIRQKSKDPISAAPLTIAFLGDSVTHGCFEIIEKRPGSFDCIYDHKTVYHQRLKEKIESVFPNCPINILNTGISGGNAQQCAERVERDVIAYSPDLAVVCLGLNDVQAGKEGLSVFESSLVSIFKQLHEAGIDTIFMTPNMVCTEVLPELTAQWLHDIATNLARLQNDGTMDLYMRTASELCAKEQVTLCDCYSQWKRLSSLGADINWLLANHINHPTREMHELFAQKLFETIFFNHL